MRDLLRGDGAPPTPEEVWILRGYHARRASRHPTFSDDERAAAE